MIQRFYSATFRMSTYWITYSYTSLLLKTGTSAEYMALFACAIYLIKLFTTANLENLIKKP